MSVTGLPIEVRNALGVLGSPGVYGGNNIRTWHGRDSRTEALDFAKAILSTHAALRQLALDGKVRFEKIYHKGLLLGWVLGVRPITVYNIWAGKELVAKYIRTQSFGHKQDSVQLIVY